jgi:hypothetical protein
MARFKVNDDAFAKLRTSAAAKALVRKEAEEIAARANAVASTTEPAADEPYYKTWDATDEERARYRVATTGLRSARHEAKTQALQKAI